MKDLLRQGSSTVEPALNGSNGSAKLDAAAHRRRTPGFARIEATTSQILEGPLKKPGEGLPRS
jgi:hypothetical protein